MQPCGIVIAELCAGETLGLRPPSAERFEDGCGLPRDLDAALRQSVFGIKTHALGVEHSQEVVRAKLESLSGEIGSGACGPRRQFQMHKALPLLHVIRDRPLSFLEG